MRVLMAVEQLRRSVPGGIGTYVRGLLQGLAQIDGAEVELLRPPAFLPPPVLTRLWDAGLLAAPDAGFDVVHAPSLLTMRTEAPLSVMVHDVAWRQVPEAFPPRGRRWHEAALARALERASVIVVPSHSTADALGHDGRVHVVEEGCDHLAPPDHQAAARLLAAYGVGEGMPYLMTVSTLEPRKNLPRLLAAYAEARSQLPEPWPLVVVGPAGWGPALAPQEGVVLTGFVDESVKSALLAGARVVAYVPLLEGWGLPAGEAMAAGAVVVASPMPSIGDAAYVVDPHDVSSIAAGLVAASVDEGVRAGLLAAGSARAASLTWAAAARRHVELWSGL